MQKISEEGSIILKRLYEEEITQIYEYYKERCENGRVTLGGKLSQRQREYYSKMLQEFEFVTHRAAKIMVLMDRLHLFVDREEEMRKLPGACMSMEPGWLNGLSVEERKKLEAIEDSVQQEMGEQLLQSAGKFAEGYDFLDYPQVYRDAQEIIWTHFSYYIAVKRRYWGYERIDK